jgi:hypothetical protein
MSERASEFDRFLVSTSYILHKELAASPVSKLVRTWKEALMAPSLISLGLDIF